MAIKPETVAAFRELFDVQGYVPNTLIIGEEVAHALGLYEIQDEDGRPLVWSDEYHGYVDPATGKPRTQA